MGWSGVGGGGSGVRMSRIGWGGFRMLSPVDHVPT